MTFYKPLHGDTAATVADGYDNNFQTLDTSKADAGATLAALDTKVDKIDGAGLMTDPERAKLAGIETAANNYIHPETHPADLITDTDEKVIMTAVERQKLTGIEAGANAYTLPAATADTLGGVKAGDNVNISEDGTLSATAEPYNLPTASSATLGGIKVGNNLSIRDDGTLDVTGGGVLIDLTKDDAGIKADIRAFAEAMAISEATPVFVRIEDGEAILPAIHFKLGDTVHYIAGTLAIDNTLAAYGVKASIDSDSVAYEVITQDSFLITDDWADNYTGNSSTLRDTDVLLVSERGVDGEKGSSSPVAVSTFAEYVGSKISVGGNAAVSPDAGNTLQQRENGLFVPAGGGSGSGILVLPYVAPEQDGEGNITNSAAFVTAWSAILTQYLAAPDQYALCMEMDVSGGEGIMVQMPCNMLNLGGDTDAVQWLLSGFMVVNMPVSSTASASCKSTCMVAVVCNAQGQMQSVAMYASTGIVGPDGQPNLLGGDDPIVVDIEDNATEDQLKTALQPAVYALQINPNRRVLLRYGLMLMPATTAISDAEFLIAVMDANPLTVSDPNSTWVVKTIVYCRHSNGVIQSAVGGVTGFEVATIDSLKNAAPVDQLKATDRLLAFNGSSYPVTATALQLNDYIQSQAPKPTYRNLCLNSRGDNLNCWDAWSGADRIEIDTAKFGRPVIKITNQFIGSSGEWWFGLASKPNMPDITPYIGTNTPLPRPVTVSCNVWCNYTVNLLVGDNNSESVSISPNKFHRISHTIPAGTVITTLGFGVGKVTQKTDLEIYYEMMQVEWGTEATPYCYNAALPQSLTEQLVPGEFWPDFDGNMRQVYIRTFKGDVSALLADSQLVPGGLMEAQLVRGGIGIDNSMLSPGMVGQAGENWGWSFMVYGGFLILTLEGNAWDGLKYNMTFKYTKA